MSWVYPFALAIVAAANATWAARRYVAPWWRRRCTVVEMCEVCGKGLTLSSVRELRSDATDDAELDIGTVGGTYMVATYCRRHFPK